MSSQFTDYKQWCRLCGSFSSLSEIDGAILPILEGTFELKPDEYRVCLDCHNSLVQFSKIYEKSRNLQKMFKGLDEENENDLDVARLNAYRSHFGLSTFEFDPPEIIESNEGEGEVMEEMIQDDCDEEVEESYVLEEVIEDIIDDSKDASMSQTFDEEIIEECLEEDEKQVTENEKLFNFQCHICTNLVYAKFKDLQNHVKKIHNCLPQVACCSQKCGKILSTWRRLMIHKEKHFPSAGDKVLRCDECFRLFSTLVGFEKHKKLHLRQFVCAYCAKVFKEAKVCRFHEMTHEHEVADRRNFECSFCGQKFVTKQACQNHIGQKHERILSYFCEFENCGKGFYTPKALCEHKRIHKEREHPCEKCSFMAKTKGALMAHMETHLTEINFRCEHCNAGFTSKKRLKTHLVVHSDETPFACTQCNGKFKRKKDLDNHLRVHSSIKAFKCIFCPRTFTNSSNCRKHKLKDHPSELKAYEAEHGVGKKYKSLN